ncbi:MAG: D-tyrosyl-tRNA(Tyr) deacylase [Clostridiales bacterium]|jgi:D-tyrosyl-tRNA(Tyr) deacylase|nr:D-tyrosyl-tRNA(Tyr) deacylase [Clostridiales bacterium]HOK82390.1 D-aminoacyl-tRNA deacylase [Clostridia bacterium]HOL61516.1 D-aminoacyl-tRNA deacylase [Clostridia bacterium]HPO53373.1 D-aminoacyl-tRNA deacylase [Clostridia bacterium]
MKAVIQRVKSAKLSVEGIDVSEIGRGLVVFFGVEKDDDIKTADYFAKKIANMRIFEDCSEKMNLSVSDLGYEVLAVSQFTLCGDCSRGNRPDFTGAEKPQTAFEVYNRFCEALEAQGITTKRGVFGAPMRIEQVNDGPVTIILAKK